MSEPNLIKRGNFIDRIKRREKKVLIVSVFLVIIIFFSAVYFLFTNFDRKDNILTIANNDMKVTLNNTQGLIQLNNKLPESDSVGLANIPVVLALTNSGGRDIARFDVELVSSKDSTLDDKYIKYAISIDNGNTYTSAKNLSLNNNIIYSGYYLKVGSSKTLYLKIWIDKDAGNHALDKLYSATVKVHLYDTVEVSGKVNQTIETDLDVCSGKMTLEIDGDTYISGSGECIDFNYVNYSDKLWRILKIYQDGSIKMITEEPVISIAYSKNQKSVFFLDQNNKSNVYEWLNKDFLLTLQDYQNLLNLKAKWNLKSTSGWNQDQEIEAAVGLLSDIEYLKSYENASYENGYLNVNHAFWLLNSYDDENNFIVNEKGELQHDKVGRILGIRPVINLKPNVKVTSGDGSLKNPFKITAK